MKAVSTNVPAGFSGFLLDEFEALARGSADRLRCLG